MNLEVPHEVGAEADQRDATGLSADAASETMRQLSELTEQLATAVVTVDAEDLVGLAALHEQFKNLREQAAQLESAPDTQRIVPLATQASQLVERLVLREIDDAAQCLRDIGEAVVQLQTMISGAPATATTAAVPAADPAAQPTTPAASVTPAAPSESSSAPAPQTSNASPDQESPLSAEDAAMAGEFIIEARGHIDTAEAELIKLEEQPDNPDSLSAIFRAFHTIKGVAGFLNLKQIGSLAHAAENLLDLARRGELKLTGAATDLVLEAIDLMKVLIADLEQAIRAQKAPTTQPALPSLLDRLRAYAAGQQPQAQDAPATASAAAAAPAEKAESRAATTAGSSAEATVKVATDRLDSLINMVGELVIAESMVRQDLAGLLADNQRIHRNMSHLGKITRSLQELSMSMRMVPIQGVFQKMARLVRDLSRKALKQIELTTAGGETELDRNVVEAIGDPLVHMVRNAVDHGIESPEDRQRAGKDPTGRIHLKSWHQAGNVVIQISDDGRGLNKEKILRKAIAAGLVQEGAQLSDPEIFQLIFHPGLSTAEKVTDISGRGVGMDVVKRNIEALRGRIEIESTEGRGSAFTIRLPLTLAVIDALVVQVGPQHYLLPITSIEKSLRPTPEQLSSVQGRGEMCMVRGQLLPLFRLHRLFGVTPLSEDPTQGLVVIVQDNQRRCGLLVDRLLGQQQVVIKSLGDLVGKVQGVSGGAILGDGNVSMILDVPGLIDLSQDQVASHSHG